MKNYLTIAVSVFFLVFFLFGASAGAQTMAVDSARMHESCQACVNAWKPSFKGETKEGITYALFAIKNKKNWVFLIHDAQNHYYAFTKKGKGLFARLLNKKGPQYNIQEQPSLFTYDLCNMYNENFFKEKSKVESVGDITLYGHYKLNRNGRKAYKNLKVLDLPYQNSKKNPMMDELYDLPEASDPLPDSLLEIKPIEMMDTGYMATQKQNAEDIEADISEEESGQKNDDRNVLEKSIDSYDEGRRDVNSAEREIDGTINEGIRINRDIRRLEELPENLENKGEQKIDKLERVIDG